MLQHNLSCRNCASLVMAIKICMHKSNPLVFFLFSSLSLWLLLYILSFFCVHGIYLLGTPFYISLFDLLRVRGSQRLFKEDKRYLFVLPTSTWENLPWQEKAGDCQSWSPIWICWLWPCWLNLIPWQDCLPKDWMFCRHLSEQHQMAEEV